MAKKKADKVVLFGTADILLGSLAEADAEIARLEKAAEEEASQVRERYQAQLTFLKRHREENEKELLKIMKSGREAFFADGDVRALPNGTLLHAVENKVVIHGKKEEVIARAEGAYLLAAIKIEKSLDRDRINKMPDDLLAVIGAERKPVEIFNYDLKKAK